MDPFTAMAIGSTVLNVAGAVSEGNAGYAQGRHEENVALENARRATQNAAQIRMAGQEAERAKRREIRRSLGRSAAAIAQSGTGTGGSNALLMKQASAEGEFDAQNTRYAYESDAYGQELEALNQRSAAIAARRQARGARTAGYINAASAALGGYSNYSHQRAVRRSLQSGTTSTRGPRYGVDVGIQNRGP